MLTELQKRKLTVQFNNRDTNNSGMLEKSDYENMAKNIGKLHDLPLDSPEYKSIYAGQMAVWDSIQNLADKDRDGKVSLDEYLEGYDGLLSDEKKFFPFLAGQVKSILTLTDTDGDGKISEEEWVALGGCYNIAEDAARESFGHLDRDGSGYLNVEELKKNFEEFFLSDDPDAPGNWLIGPY